jgi:hypothetical protein
MKRCHSAVCLTLAVLVVLGLVGPAAAQVQVPFKGGLVGVDTAIPIPNTTFASVTVKAAGNATYLGKFTFTGLISVNTATGMGSGPFCSPPPTAIRYSAPVAASHVYAAQRPRHCGNRDYHGRYA